jgi:hypothetical protein
MVIKKGWLGERILGTFNHKLDVYNILQEMSFLNRFKCYVIDFSNKGERQRANNFVWDFEEKVRE